MTVLPLDRYSYIGIYLKQHSYISIEKGDNVKQIEPNEVARIAWALGDKYALPENSVKLIATLIWALIHPEKESWKRCPKKPD